MSRLQNYVSVKKENLLVEFCDCFAQTGAKLSTKLVKSTQTKVSWSSVL